MSDLVHYRTKTGKTGVVCPCGHRVLLTSRGTLYRHSPIKISDGAWCKNGERHVSEVGR